MDKSLNLIWFYFTAYYCPQKYLSEQRSWNMYLHSLLNIWNVGHCFYICITKCSSWRPKSEARSNSLLGVHFNLDFKRETVSFRYIQLLWTDWDHREAAGWRKLLTAQFYFWSQQTLCLLFHLTCQHRNQGRGHSARLAIRLRCGTRSRRGGAGRGRGAGRARLSPAARNRFTGARAAQGAVPLKRHPGDTSFK